MVLRVGQVPMLVLYIGIMKVKGFWPNPKISSIFTINLTVQQYSQAPYTLSSNSYETLKISDFLTY